MRFFVHSIRTAALVLALSFSVFFSNAQSISSPNGKFEIGLGLGPMFFLGDLGGGLGKGTKFVKDVNLPLTKMQKGLFINYYPQEWIGFRVSANHGVLEGADSIIKEKGGDETYRYNRNLHFRSSLLEVYGAIEFYPTVFLEEYDGLQGKIRPYGLVGLGMVKFKPQTEYYSPNGTKRWVDLEPLQIEGQGMTEYPDRPRYKLTTMEIPVGVGIKWFVKENMYIGMEILHRHTFTDYIDDLSKDYIDPTLYDKYLSPENAVVARQVQDRKAGTGGLGSNPTFIGEQRGNSKNNDAFFSSILRFGWRLFDNSDVAGMGCPKW
jgi:opacity protein-like surface antigen